MIETKRTSQQRLSARFRRGRDHAVREIIDHLAASSPTVRILYMGGTIAYWQRIGVDYLRARGCHVTILNIDEGNLVGASDDLFKLVVGDATNMPQFADGCFDFAHSNSVIEHLVTWDAMHRVADETMRVAKCYYVQTPNFWFPIEPHFYSVPMLHWLPRPLQASLFHRFPIAQGGRMKTWDEAFAVSDEARLLVRRQLQVLFPEATISAERVLGMSKSLIVRGG